MLIHLFIYLFTKSLTEENILSELAIKFTKLSTITYSLLAKNSPLVPFIVDFYYLVCCNSLFKLSTTRNS